MTKEIYKKLKTAVKDNGSVIDTDVPFIASAALSVFEEYVVFLPHDAEPIEGDYVKYRPKESPHWKDRGYYRIDKLTYIGDTPLKTLGHYRLDECEILSIVYRDGYKAVIQEEKDNEHIQD